MKARVKETSEIFKVVGVISNAADGYTLDEVDLFCDESDNLIIGVSEDYWEKLKHQYAGMAMQGMLSNPRIMETLGCKNDHERLIETTISIATALVEKLKEDSYD